MWHESSGSCYAPVEDHEERFYDYNESINSTASAPGESDAGPTRALDKYLPLIKRKLGAALKYYTIDKGLTGGTPGAPAAYAGMCHLLCDSVEAYQSSYGPHADEISRDIRNYTDQTPVMQISEVVVENSAKG